MLFFRWMLVIALLAPMPRAGTVTLRDGKRHTGTVELRGAKIIVAADGKRSELALTDIANVDFASEAAKAKPGHGLRGEYFSGRNLKRAMFVRDDPQILFNWSQAPPHPSLAAWGREFSVRWSGHLTSEFSEKHRLIANTDDGVRVWIDDRLVIDAWYDQAGGDVSGEIELRAAVKHKLVVEYYNGAGAAFATLSWSSASRPRQVIGPENLLLPAAKDESEPTLMVRAGDGGGDLRRVLESARSGLKAEYYAGREFNEFRFIRFDPNIDFHYHSENPPDPTVSPEGSVRWTGMLEPRKTGEHRFKLDVHRRARLWVNGELVIDRWFGEGGEFTSQTISLTAGKKVPIKLEFSSPQGSMACRLYWSTAGTAYFELISPEAFSPASDEKLGRPALTMLSPAADAIEYAPSAVKLEAHATTPNGDVAKVEFFDRSTLIGYTEDAPFAIMLDKPRAGVYKIRARLTDSAGVTALTEPASLVVLGQGDGSLKAPWGDYHIANNDYRAPGVGRVDRGVFRIDKALGTMLADEEHDAGHLIVQPLLGDGEIVARLAERRPDDPLAGAFAGITIRESLKNRCKQASLVQGILSEDPVVAFVRRQDHWMNPVSTERQIGGPYWLKLVRHGSRVHAYTSNDGKSWDLFASERFETGPQVFVGMVAFGRDKERPASAVFDNVKVTAGSPAVETSTRGILTTGGTFLACEPFLIEDSFVRYNRNNREQKIPLNDVARLLYKPLLTDHAEKIPAGGSGALLGSGDFVEGEVKSVRDAHVAVSSVLFGLKRVHFNDDLTAVVLKDAKAEKTPLVISARDGSVYRAKSLREEKGEAVIEDASLGEVRVPVGTLAGVRSE